MQQYYKHQGLTGRPGIWSCSCQSTRSSPEIISVMPCSTCSPDIFNEPALHMHAHARRSVVFIGQCEHGTAYKRMVADLQSGVDFQKVKFASVLVREELYSASRPVFGGLAQPPCSFRQRTPELRICTASLSGPDFQAQRHASHCTRIFQNFPNDAGGEPAAMI